ncbi:MAG: 4-hydroxy-3-methylbut-2-enyl diphosphate reductase [Planctomycetes bacterium]|nr:4-hydroxy-3-methylbut-2-enyl diphosphate reductase [Planctomycetota bacterium]
MKVKLATTAGFCMGVRRAMNIVLDAAAKEGGPVYTLGPLIHNPQVLNSLDKKNVHVLDEESDASESTTVIRAHGIGPEERERLESRAGNVRDATCPHVIRLQSIVKKHVEQGYSCIIVGDRGHAEVIGILGYAGGKGHVVETLDEIESLPDLDKVCVVAQTTQNREMYEEVTRRMKEVFPNAEVFDTICDSTGRRQAEVISLAKESDAIIVVGGRGSANTNRLAEVARKTGAPTFHVETAEEIDPEQLKNFKTVGITAGASTPNYLIMDVVERVTAIRPGPLGGLINAAAFLMTVLTKTNLYVAAGGASLCYACCVMLGVQPRRNHLLIASLYILAMHTANRLTDEYADQFAAPFLPNFYARFRRPLAAVVALAVLVALVLCLREHLAAFILILIACVAGALYRVRILPASLKKLIRYDSLKDIPGMKEVFTAGAWAAVTVVVPAFGYKEIGIWRPGLYVVMLYAFSLVLMRNVLYDVRDIQRDKIVGRETIPTVLGLMWTKVLLSVLAGALTGLLILSGALGWTSPVAYVMILTIAYASSYLFLYHLRLIVHGTLGCEIIVDANFIIAGLLAAMSQAKFI